MTTDRKPLGTAVIVAAATRTLGSGARGAVQAQHTGEVVKAGATRSLRTGSTIPCRVTE